MDGSGLSCWSSVHTKRKRRGCKPRRTKSRPALGRDLVPDGICNPVRKVLWLARAWPFVLVFRPH